MPYLDRNKDIERKRRFRLEHPEKVREYKKRYYLKHRDKIRDARNIYRKKKLLVDKGFYLSEKLRIRLHSALKHGYKTGSAIRDLGCSIKELEKHLESLFTEGMSWEKFGGRGIQIDHIKPLSSFDLTDREQLLQACHYTNLQPLWYHDNELKSDKVL